MLEELTQKLIIFVSRDVGGLLDFSESAADTRLTTIVADRHCFYIAIRRFVKGQVEGRFKREGGPMKEQRRDDLSSSPVPLTPSAQPDRVTVTRAINCVK